MRQRRWRRRNTLAREYGFASWPALVHHVESLQPHRRMLQPAELKSDQPLMWSAGRGTNVWALFQACAEGDLPTVRALVAKDRSLARAHYDYRSRSISPCARTARAIPARARGVPQPVRRKLG
jgi:hypothetical protein